jgi:hypothetical protein
MHTKQVLFALFACTSTVFAQSGSSSDFQELLGAIDACKKEQIDAVCKVGKISGTCQEVSDAYIVCKSCYMNYWADITRTIQ